MAQLFSDVMNNNEAHFVFRKYHEINAQTIKTISFVACSFVFNSLKPVHLKTCSFGMQEGGYCNTTSFFIIYYSF